MGYTGTSGRIGIISGFLLAIPVLLLREDGPEGHPSGQYPF